MVADWFDSHKNESNNTWFVVSLLVLLVVEISPSLVLFCFFKGKNVKLTEEEKIWVYSLLQHIKQAIEGLGFCPLSASKRVIKALLAAPNLPNECFPENDQRKLLPIRAQVIALSQLDSFQGGFVSSFQNAFSPLPVSPLLSASSSLSFSPLNTLDSDGEQERREEEEEEKKELSPPTLPVIVIGRLRSFADVYSSTSSSSSQKKTFLSQPSFLKTLQTTSPAPCAPPPPLLNKKNKKTRK